MTDRGIGAARIFVVALGLATTGLALWAGWRMFDHQVSTEELLMWIAAAWTAWTALVGLEVLLWTRRNAAIIRGALNADAA